MAFFENLGKKVGNAAQAAAKKSSEIVETTKLNASINTEENNIQKLYSLIGKTIYEKYRQTGDSPDDVKEACEQITAHEQTINDLREKIAEVRGIKSCIGCGAEMERSQLFCSKCGAKNELPQMSEVASADAQPEAAPACPSCGSPLTSNSAFCTNCGTKL